MRDAFYDFGPFRLDVQRRRLSRDGVLLPLPGKAVDTLAVLVQHPGKTLERSALIHAVWGDTFVEDANLSVAVSHLRRALKDETEEYIGTVARVGYRFVAD